MNIWIFVCKIKCLRQNDRFYNVLLQSVDTWAKNNFKNKSLVFIKGLRTLAKFGVSEDFVFN
jgi:hypothetical protein